MKTPVVAFGAGAASKNVSHRVGAVDDFIVEIQASGRLAFSSAEITDCVGIHGRALEAALRRRAATGSLVRVAPRTGFFLIVPPDHRAIETPPMEAWLDDLMACLGQAYYAGLLSAAAWRGSSHFELQETKIVMTAWMRPSSVGRTRLRFFQRPSADRMPTEVRQSAWGEIKLAWPETMAVDLLQHQVCSIDRTAMVLSDLSNLLRAARLRAALDAGADVPTAQRLGLLLNAIGRPNQAKVVEDWISDKPRRTVDLAAWREHAP